MDHFSRPLTERFGNLDHGDYRTERSKLWETIEQLTQPVVQMVESQAITPLQGAAVEAAIHAQVLGFPEFQSELTSDLVDTAKKHYAGHTSGA